MSGEKRRWVFVLEMATGGDLLLRALSPFPAAQALYREAKAKGRR